MAADDFFGAGVDMASALGGLNNLGGPIAQSLARSMCVAGGKLFRDEAKLLVPVGEGKWYGTSTTPGLLKSAIYLAYKDQVSTTELKVYSVSWNVGIAPHGHWIEFGRVQRFVVAQDPQGEWYTTKVPLPAPRFIAGHPFLRPAYETMKSPAIQAMIDRAVVRLPELIQGAYQPRDEEFV